MRRRHKFVRTPDPLYIEDEEEAEYWVERYLALESLGYDTETTGLHKINDRIKFFSFSDGDSRICCPVRLLPLFGGILADPDIEKCMTNSKYDMHLSENHGIEVRGRVPDTTVQSWAYDENRRGRHGLKPTSQDFLGLRMAPFKEVFGSVGKTENEVGILVRMHDALEAHDSDEAADLLALVGKVDGDEKVLKSIQKISLSKQGGYVMDARKVLAQARIHEIAGKTHGKQGYVSDFLGMLGGEDLTVKERQQYFPLLEDKTLIKEGHEIVLRELRKLIRIDMEPLEMLKLLVADYASLDAWGSFKLVHLFRDMLDEIETGSDENSETLLEYFEGIAVPYTRVLWNMERRGFKMDLDLIDKYRRPMAKDISQIEREVVSMVGYDINLNSPLQLRQAFFTQDRNGDWVDRFDNPPMKWTKGGASGVKNPSTDKECIEKWAEKGDELASSVQDFRKLSKLHNTYLVGVPAWVDYRGRIHTDLKQHGTVTGRLSSGDPNLQNIPSKGDWGRRIRQAFIAGEWGECSPRWCMEHLRDVEVPDLHSDTPMRLIVADYEQLEMRIMAHFSEDETMIETIHDGNDLHSMTAALAGGYDYDEIVAAKKADNPTEGQLKLIDIRSGFKAVSFGLIYGIGPVKLGRQLGLEVTEHRNKRTGRIFERCPAATELIKTYFDIYPDVKRFIDGTKAACKEDLYVQTIEGRFRRLPDIISGDGGVRSAAERQAVNSIVQGSAADITVAAMIKCENDEELRSLGVRMLLQIHDELVFEVPDLAGTSPSTTNVPRSASRS